VSGALKQIYRVELKMKAPSTADVVLKGPPIPEGHVALIETVHLIDLTTANKTMRIGYERAGEQFWISRRNTGTGNYDLRFRLHVQFTPGERPIAMVESPTVGDEILFVCRGFLQPVKGSG